MNTVDYIENISGSENSFGINAGRKIVKYLIGSIFGIVIVLVLTSLFSLVMTINAVPDGAANILPYIIVFCGAFTAGLIATAKIGLNGMVNGALCGFVFFIIQMLISLVFRSGSIFTMAMLIYLIIDVVSGSVGGISAVNVFKTKRN